MTALRVAADVVLAWCVVSVVSAPLVGWWLRRTRETSETRLRYSPLPDRGRDGMPANMTLLRRRCDACPMFGCVACAEDATRARERVESTPPGHRIMYLVGGAEAEHPPDPLYPPRWS